MANRRMFSLDVVDTDRFLDMPPSTQSLYFNLGMRADDDGFVSSPKKICNLVGSNNDDLRLLIAKNYLIPFENGVVVITDWKVNNWLRPDRKKQTIYKNELSNLQEVNGQYILSDNIQPNDNQVTTKRHTQNSIGKDSIDKHSIESISASTESPPHKTKKFVKPTVEEVKAYCEERGNNIDPEHFVDYYESNGWMVGKNKMKDWHAAIRTWERRDKNSNEDSANTHIYNNVVAPDDPDVLLMKQYEYHYDEYTYENDPDAPFK